MKIGLVRRGYSATGGAERYLLRFARGLEDAGHTCVLFSDRQWPEEAWRNREIRVLQNAGSPKAFADALAASQPGAACDFLFSLERVWACDVYRAGDGVHRAWMDRRAKFESRRRSLLREWNPKHRQILKLESALYGEGSSTHLIANSRMVADEIGSYHGCDPARITIIPNGYDPPAEARNDELVRESRAAMRQKLGLAKGEMAVLFVGSGWERKGLRFAVEAVKRLHGRSHRPVKLLVAGRMERNRPEDSPQVLFLEAVKDLTPVYAAADVFVLPTLYDPFSNASLEAAAHGLPVVTTAANGFSQILPEIAGYGSVTHAGDVEGLTEALAWHAERDEAQQWEQRSSIRQWAGKYSVRRNVEATLDCFERLTRNSTKATQPVA